MTDTPAFYLGVDYELFFGERHGSVDACLIEPTRALVAVLAKHGAYLTVFADVGYLCALKRCALQHPELEKDRTRVLDQLKWILDEGHDVQLHVHPHWEDCTFADGRWKIDTSRYRLHDFDDVALAEVVRRYADVLIDDIGHTPRAYRAGGWCLTPFPRIGAALRQAGIWIDSTVYAGGVSTNLNREFDFLAAPDLDRWRFDIDPVAPADGGYFLELPISSVSVRPPFWFAGELRKRLAPDRFKRFGDGESLGNSARHYADRLLRRSVIPVTVDQYRATTLFMAYDRIRRARRGVVNAMGHPKAITPDSLRTLDRFLTQCEVEPMHFGHLAAQHQAEQVQVG